MGVRYAPLRCCDPFIDSMDVDAVEVTFVNDVGSLVEPLTPDMIGNCG